MADFREVEHNFRQLDLKVRRQIALWDGSKGELLNEIMGERDAITDSDQGKSFRAFWDFLLSQQRQQEFTVLLEYLYSLPAIKQLNLENTYPHIHYDWLEAGEHTQRTIAQLSQQLRHFLDDKAWLENRRIMEIFREIEGKVFELSEEQLKGQVMTVADTKVNIALPMERPLYMPSAKTTLANTQLELGTADIEAESLFNQIVIDKAKLIANARMALQGKSQITLQKIAENYPLEQGLAEIIGYLQLDNTPYFKLVIDESIEEKLTWFIDDKQREVKLPRIIFIKGNHNGTR